MGATFVPENIWRPAECYIINQVEDMSVVSHADQPILVDSEKGLLLWPIEFCGCVLNPMDLHRFPFDRDSVEVHVHQAESSSRDEFVLRPWPEPDEATSVRFFFDLATQVNEFRVVGFSKECWEQTGGNLVEYSHCLLQLYTIRRSKYYIYKVAVPVLLCTVFCFSAFFFPVVASEGTAPDGQIFKLAVDVTALSERNNLAATMFLAAAALMYVVSAELPKVAYLTTMDIFVNVNLFIQFVIALISWVVCHMPDKAADAAVINQVSAVILLLVLTISTALLLVVPWIKELQHKITDWPKSLGREVPEVKYYPFKYFENIFPPWQPGTKNPIALPPKVYSDGGKLVA